MPDDDGLLKSTWGRLKGDPLGRRTLGQIEVNDAFGLAGRSPESEPVQDTGGYVRHYDRGWESSREPAIDFYKRTAPAPPDEDVVKAEAASVARSAVRQLEAEHTRAAEREAIIARRLSDAREAAAALEGPL